MNDVSLARRAAVFACAAALVSCDRRPAPPDPTAGVGGVSIGMSLDAYRSFTSKPPGFQLGGIDGAPDAVFVGDKLQKFTWRFPAEKFQLVRSALVAQFPQMKCEHAAGHEVCTADKALTLVEGQRGGTWTSYVALERRRGN